MKRDGMILVWVLSGLAVATTTPAITDGSNPYGRIVDRNVFSLKPPVPITPPEPPPPPAPTIKLQGITSILGRRQVLFKVAAAKPGDKEQSYVLSEGERDGEIEVLSIDENAGTIRFNNHGAMQTLSMDKDASAPPPVTAAIPGVIPRPAPGMPRPGGAGQTAASGGGAATAGGQKQGLRSIPTRPTRGGSSSATPTLAGGLTATGGTTGGNATTGGTAQPTHPPMSPEEQVILIEVERERTRLEVDVGELPPLPPTELTPPGSTGIPDDGFPRLPQ